MQFLLHMWSYFGSASVIMGIFLMIGYCYRNVKSFKKDKREAQPSQILVVTNEWECEQACLKLVSHCYHLSALGFDCEWVSDQNGLQKPVSLLQLASPNGLCCLFRLNMMGYVPHLLNKIMTDRGILKLGVNTSNDARLLLKDYALQMEGALDLRHLYPNQGGLASLAKSVANIELNKSLAIQCSNWNYVNLTEAQKTYAAMDALAGIEIFKQWLLDHAGEKSLTAEMMVNDYSPFISIIRRLLDIPFKPIYSNAASKKTPVSLFMNNQKKLKDVYVTRKSPLYHNCFMHAPDGELLCSCDRRKAEWYAERGLAEVLPGDPYSIRLLFEPAARAGDTNGGRYYQQLKQNCCVVCGALQSYVKHNVVPKEYRKHFPIEMKDHQSHDIVLTCIRCHHLAAQHNDFLKQQLALKCNAPIINPKTVQNSSTQKVKNCAKALITSGNVIPPERKNTLENEVKRFYNVNYLSQDLLQEAANLNTKTINKNFESHGVKVVNYYRHIGGGLMKLEKLWREHFIKTMNPQYLPALWSVTHNHSRLAAKAAEKQV